MNNKSNNDKFLHLVFWVGLLLLYILFPTQTHSVDAWGFAANVKFAQDLFSPHHLLYNATGFIIKNLLNTFGFYPDVMRLLLFMNGITAWLAMIVLYIIVKKSGHSALKSFALVSIAAFSFGIWRFATENETYILPIFFSLLASYYYTKFYINKNQLNRSGLYLYAFLSGLFAAVSCLYHQIHVFWWFGLCISLLFMTFSQNIRFWLNFILPVFLVPFTYIIVLKFYQKQEITFTNLWHFAMYDVYSGAVGGKFGAKHLLLGIVNLFRSFIQLHGTVLYLFKYSLLFIIPAFIALIALIYESVIFWRNFLKVKITAKPVFTAHTIIFLLQWLFAVYNVGNAEFMAMLPVLLVIMLSAENPVPAKGLVAIAIMLLAWNFSFGIWSNYKYRFSSDEKIAEIVNANKTDRFILVERGIVATKLHYINGKLPGNTLANPAYYASRPDKNIDLKAKLDSLLDQRINVYTDCTGRPQLLNRAAIIDSETDTKFFREYNLSPAYSFPTLAGTHKLYKVSRKK